MFQKLTNLEELNLKENQIQTINEGAFDEISNLKQLWLWRNEMTTVKYGMFRGLNSLSRIVLQENNIQEVEDGSFRDLKKLEYLFLNSNEFTKVTSEMFSGLESLELISLYDNKINRIDQNAFSNLKSLTSLILANNSLTKLPDDMLNHFNVGANLLTTVDSCLFADIKRPLELDISLNPLQCEEKQLCWLYNEEKAGTIIWYNVSEPYPPHPFGTILKPNCADGIDWDDIMWNCTAGNGGFSYSVNKYHLL